MIPPDFSTFWSQAAQQGFHPKIVTIGKALLFPSAVNSLGPRGNGLTTEIWWTPNFPFKSGLTGQSARATHRCLYRCDQAAVDAADRLSACVVRSGDRRIEAQQKHRSQSDPRRHRGDQLPIDCRPGAVDRTAGQERQQDAAGRRPVAAQGRRVRSGGHRKQIGAGNPGRRQAQLLS